MTKRRRIGSSRFGRTATLIAAALVALTGVANAGPFEGTCGGELTSVELAILDAHFMGRNASTDQSSLLVKLDAVAARIEQKRLSDAVDGLEAISDAATSWAQEQKPRLKDATDINLTVGDVIVCVKQIP